MTIKKSAQQASESRLLTRFDVARQLGKNARTIVRHEREWKLLPLRVNGRVCYQQESVEALVQRWRDSAEPRPAGPREIAVENSRCIAPSGWHIIVDGPIPGPFIGEWIPVARSLAEKMGIEQESETASEIDQNFQLIVSYQLLSEAFGVAAEEGLNIISNGRGMVALLIGIPPQHRRRMQAKAPEDLRLPFPSLPVPP